MFKDKTTVCENILSGKKLSRKIKNHLKIEVESIKNFLGVTPKLVVILVGDNFASKKYVANKEKMAKELGIEAETIYLKKETSEEELLAMIKTYNNSCDGLLVQLPLPKYIDENKILNAISPNVDVDGFNPINIGKLHAGMDIKGHVPCTAAGIIELIKSTGTILEGKKVVVIGRSNIVGRPVACLLERENCTVTICHSKTPKQDLIDELRRADIIVSATGKPKFITKEFIGFHQILIDVGINRDENDKLCGDFDFDGIKDIAKYITPVPGGVGPMTITMLMKNVIDNCKKINKLTK